MTFRLGCDFSCRLRRREVGQGGREIALLLNSIGQLNLAQRNSCQSPLQMTHFFPLLLIWSVARDTP